MINGQSILITGATGSFGRRFVETLLYDYSPRRVVVFSRDELKQSEMSHALPEAKHKALRYFLGDVRDRDRLNLACSGVDIIIHAAAIKQVPAAERNPMECIATNVLGAENIIQASIANRVQRVIALSTDKAANPINLYGATKLASDKLFVAANNLSGSEQTRFSVVRYGNVIGSRGSVIPYFKKLKQDGSKRLPITDSEMTRFVITLDQGVRLVIHALEEMLGGEIFVPKLPSVKIIDIARYISGNDDFDIVGIRPGEKKHEVMIPREEARNCVDMSKYYVIKPQHAWWNDDEFKERVNKVGEPVPADWEYSSDTNSKWLTDDEISKLVDACPVH